MTKWQLYDPIAVTTVTFDINPDTGGSPEYNANVTYQNTVAPNGTTQVFAGSPQAVVINFSGTLITQTQFDIYTNWFNTQYALQLTDDLGRVFQVVLTKFVPKRVRSRSAPWKHTFDCTATVLSYVE